MYLLHGYLGNPLDFSPLIKELRDKFSSNQFPKDTMEFIPISVPSTTSKKHTLKYLQDSITNADILVGYSMGGRLLLELKKQNPAIAKKYIVMSADPSTIDKEKRQKWDLNWIEYALKNGVKPFLDKWYSQELFSCINREKTIQNRKNLTIEDIVSPLKHLSPANQNCLWDQLEQENTFYLCGEKDKKYSNLLKRANTKSFLVKDASHAIHLEKPGVCAEEIYRFIKEYCDAIDKRADHY